MKEATSNKLKEKAPRRALSASLAAADCRSPTAGAKRRADAQCRTLRGGRRMRSARENRARERACRRARLSAAVRRATFPSPRLSLSIPFLSPALGPRCCALFSVRRCAAALRRERWKRDGEKKTERKRRLAFPRPFFRARLFPLVPLRGEKTRASRGSSALLPATLRLWWRRGELRMEALALCVSQLARAVLPPLFPALLFALSISHPG